MENSKEAPEITGKWYNEPLLEYVRLVADRCFPDCEPDEETSDLCLCQSVFPMRFLIRLKKSKINYYYTYEKYLKANCIDDIYNILKVLGIDTDKFWYLLLFVSDVVDGAFQLKEDKKPIPQQEVSALSSKILDNIKLKEYGTPDFCKKMELILRIDGEKHTVRVKSEKALFFIANAIETFDINNITDNNTRLCLSLMDSVAVEVEPNTSEADSPPIAYFTRIMREFLYNILPEIKPETCTDLSVNQQLVTRDKMFLISKLVHFTHLSPDNKFEISSQRLKDLWKQPTYKNIPFSQPNIHYCFVAVK